MVNRWAVTFFVLFVLFFLASAFADGYFGPKKNLPEYLLMVSMLFLFLGTTKLRTYPHLYVPSGLYRVLFAKSNGENVLVALRYIDRANSNLFFNDREKRNIEDGVTQYLGRTRLFYIPIEWFQAEDGFEHWGEDYLVCRRVKTHALVNVSDEFHKKYCTRNKSAASTQAA